ncbi:MAG: protein kinase domain-containing protein [Streptosporangiaceae bacterium]
MAREWDVPGYTEVKTLGSGGFGEVVLARHDASGVLVAIKYLRPELLADPEFAAMFRSEAAVLASVADPNVVRLYEYVESPSGAAIVMELVDGVALREILARQGQTTAEAALVVLQGSLLGLAAAHRRGVVHRDYKPENVLVNAQGASKLTDFGIAARAGDRAMAAGTLAYAPPEQFGGGPATPSGDVYAATATFYECLTGRPPFSGDTAERLMHQHLAEPVPLEPVPGPLRPLIEAGMAKDPGRRPADAAALVTGLRTMAAGAYGPDWEQRGRSHLGEAALLLAALWPSGASAAAQGTAVHKVSLLRHLRPRHIGPLKGGIAAGAAATVAVVAVVVAAQSRPAPPAPFPTITGALGGVADTSADSAWAVGDTSFNANSKTVIMRWNGTDWTRVPSPDPGTFRHVADVAAASDGSAWAVGCTGCNTKNSINSQTLIMRWNGTAWTRVPSPSPGPSSYLESVAVAPDGTAWAVGWTDSTSYLLRTLILRWNGTAWTRMPSPDPGTGPGAGDYLSGVGVTPGGTAWAVGYNDSSGGISTLILRWNGTAWTTVPSPSPADSYLSRVTAAPDGTAWAVGWTGGNTNAPTRTLIMRWNGNVWTTVPYPSPAGSYLDGVITASDGSAWAVGWTGSGASSRTLILRWNGTAWTRVPSPDPGPGAALTGVIALSGSDAWAVGAADGKTLILRWNGQTWSGPAGQVSPTTAPTSSAAASPASSAVVSPASSAVPSPGSSSVASPASSAVTSPAVPSRRQAAQALSALLAQSGTDRASITQAFSAVASCSPGLSQDETVFNDAASSRQELLAKLAALPGRSALPASMLQDLTMAWQVSGEADEDFARWTQDEISRGCSTNDQADANYSAAKVPDDQATTYKKAFVALWTPIANEYGLPVYQYNQI